MYNFPINERPYDVTKTGPLLVFDSTKGVDERVVTNNLDTACGLPLFYEN